MNKLMILTPLIFFLTACGRNHQDDISTNGINVSVQNPVNEEKLDSSEFLSLHMIYVGEGDALLLIQGEYSMLIDGGEIEMGNRVVSYLLSYGIDNLTYLVNTHPFSDHVGGLSAVLRNIRVENALISMITHNTPIFYDFLDTLEESSATVVSPFAGDIFTLGQANITVLSPNSTDLWENRANFSIVLRVEFGNTSFLLMGDAMREVEASLLDSSANLSANVLKVGRHGIASSTTTAFLEAVNPNIALISTGEDGFLSSEVLSRLSNSNIPVFRTDLNGNVVVTSDGNTISVMVDR